MHGAETGDRGDKEASDGALQGQNPMSHVSSECGHTVNSNRRNGARTWRCVCVCGLCARGNDAEQKGRWVPSSHSNKIS